MKKEHKLLIFLALLVAFCCIALGSVIAAIIVFNMSAPPTIKACTEEAKLCADGSAVGRTGPNCEFALCPEEKSNLHQSTKDCCTSAEKALGYNCVQDCKGPLVYGQDNTPTYSCLAPDVASHRVCPL